MKLLILLLCIAFIGCDSSRNSVQVQYKDGKVEWANNPRAVPVKAGDSLIISYYSSMKVYYSNTEVYGYYKGIIPDIYMDSLRLLSYSVAVAIK